MFISILKFLGTSKSGSYLFCLNVFHLELAKVFVHCGFVFNSAVCRDSRHSPSYQDTRIKYTSCQVAWKSADLFLSVGKIVRLSINKSEWIPIGLWIGGWAGLSEANTRYFQVCIFTIWFNIIYFQTRAYIPSEKKTKKGNKELFSFVCL